MDDITPQQPQKPQEDIPPASRPASPPVVVAKKKGRVPIIILSGLTAMLFGLLSSALYLKWTEAEDAKTQLSDAQSALVAAQAAAKDKESANQKPTNAAKTEDFSAFLAEYNKMSAAAVAISDDETKAIEAAIKDHFKLATLPVGWTVVVAYKDAKADTTTGKPVNALVYWPALEQKPATFFEVAQMADGKWAYNKQQ